MRLWDSISEKMSMTEAVPLRSFRWFFLYPYTNLCISFSLFHHTSASLIQMRTFYAPTRFYYRFDFPLNLYHSNTQLITCAEVPSTHEKNSLINVCTHTMSITIKSARTLAFTFVGNFQWDLRGENHLSFSNAWRQNAIKSIKFRLCSLQINVWMNFVRVFIVVATVDYVLFVVPTCSQWFQCTSFINLCWNVVNGIR